MGAANNRMAQLTGPAETPVGGARRGGMTALEIADVRAWMARTGAGWQAAADYAGRERHGLRMLCDPEYARRFGGLGGGGLVGAASAGAKVVDKADPRAGSAGRVTRRAAPEAAPPAAVGEPARPRPGPRGKGYAEARFARLLGWLAQEPGGAMPTTTLGEFLGQGPFVTNSVLRRMAVEGWVAQRRPVGGGRSFWWAITDRGRAWLAAYAPALDEGADGMGGEA